MSIKGKLRVLRIIYLSIILAVSVGGMSNCELPIDPNSRHIKFGKDLPLKNYEGFDVEIIGSIPENNFFPLSEGMRWKYELVYQDQTSSDNSTHSNNEITVEITEITKIDGKEYYVIPKYFLPGPTVPEPTLLYRSDHKIYVRLNEEDYLLYSFDQIPNEWRVPLYINPSWLRMHEARRAYFEENAAIIAWDLWWYDEHKPVSGITENKPIPGDSEYGWAEYFQKGLGRVRIELVTQGRGREVWDLKAITH